MNEFKTLRFSIPVLILTFIAFTLRIAQYTVLQYRMSFFALLLFANYILLAICTVAPNSSRIIMPIIFIATAALYMEDFQYLNSSNIKSWLFAILAVSFILAALNDIIRFSKTLPLIAPAIGVATYMIIFILDHYINISILANLAYYVSLFMFGMNSKSFMVSPQSNTATSSEEKLKLLKEKLDSGEISEQQYRIKRAEIISEL